jgi:hypothetical protein
MKSPTTQPDKKDLQEQERGLQKTLRKMIAEGDSQSDSFWKVRQELDKVVLALYVNIHHPKTGQQDIPKS